jgi:hypothetical protein
MSVCTCLCGDGPGREAKLVGLNAFDRVAKDIAERCYRALSILFFASEK